LAENPGRESGGRDSGAPYSVRAPAALIVSPWLIWSYLLTGSPALSTETGFLLWASNNPYTFSHYPRESADRNTSAALEALRPQEKAQMEPLVNEAL
jgi:hypothetical protein